MLSIWSKPWFHFSLSAASAGQAGGGDVPGVEIAVADDFDHVDAFDLFVDQLEDRGAEIAGDAAIGSRAFESVLEENVAQAAGA